MKVRGIKHGQTIELLEVITNIPDGMEIEIEIPEIRPTSQEDRWASLDRVLGAWKDDPETAAIFAEIDRERHADLGKPVNFDGID